MPIVATILLAVFLAIGSLAAIEPAFELTEEQKKIEIVTLEKKVASIPASNFEYNLKLYRKLAKLDHSNERYRRKVAHYKRKLSLKIRQEKLAAAKRREEKSSYFRTSETTVFYKVNVFKYNGTMTKDKYYTVVTWRAGKHPEDSMDWIHFNAVLIEGHRQISSGYHPLVAGQFCRDHGCNTDWFDVETAPVSGQLFPGATSRGIIIFPGEGKVVFSDS